MSDFLNKFNKNNYKNLIDEKKEDTKEVKDLNISNTKDDKVIDTVEDKEPNKEEGKIDLIEETNIKQETTLDQKIFGEEKASNNRSEFEEDIVIDKDYNKKKIIQYSIIGVTVLIVCLSAFLIFRLSNQVTVPDFTGETLSQAQNWAAKNKIELKIERNYNLEHDSNVIFEQSKEGGKKIQKGTILNVTVSDGADPNELISLPDFSNMNRSDIELWKETNKVNNLRIVLEYHNEIQKDHFIRFEIRDTSITNETYRRKDIATIYISRGVEVFEKNITVPDFTNKNKAEVEQWAKNNEINVIYNEADSDTVELNHIISQSIAPDAKIAKKEEITVYVSLGKAIIIPNFGYISYSEAANYPIDGLTIMVRGEYSTSIAYGNLISQSIAQGTKLIGEKNNTIIVTYSIGRPFIRDLTGTLENELAAEFYDFQLKGANITYSLHYVDSPSGTRGTVIGATYSNEFVPMNTHVYINIGRGNL